MSTNFSPTPAELTIVSQIFAQADPQKLGVLTGDVAVRVFGGAKLPPVTLGEIWNISDEDNKGWLPKRGVAIAVRLIGWAQKGEKITQALVNKPGPLAVIEGVATVARQNTGMSSPRSPPPSTFPPLTPQDKAKFQNMFLKSGPTNGLLSGEKARDIFVKSKLSNEQLMQIWNLADTQDRGALDSTDFAVGMYLIQGVMTGKISFVPSALPPGLYQQAGGSIANSGSVRSHMTGNSGSFSPVGTAFAPQHTGQSQMLQPDHTGMSGPFRAPALPARPHAFAHSNGHAQDWDVTPAEKASADRYFDTLDTQKRGYIEGEVAVPFMLKSQLPGEVLAQIWDLADINNDGCLTRDGFAVAMYLIQKKLAGQEIPDTLPPSLVPPSSRATAIGASPFSPLHTQTHHQPEPVVDLFSFDDTPPPSAVQPRPREVSGHLKAQATGPTHTGFPQAPAQRTFESDPFSVPSFSTSPHHDLLGDDDTHGTSSPIHDHSVEIGNVRNQLQSTERSLSTAKEERATLEQTLASQASQLSTLQTQLSSAKAAYETEIDLLVTLKERRLGQITEIQRTKEELIRAESDLSAVRVEKAEIEGAFLRDKEDARDLHKRMIEVGQHVDTLKADVEKVKREAKQQKGLLAIARKQLSTKEHEKVKVEKEHEEAVAEVASVSEEKEAVEAEIANFVSSPTPKVAGPLSPSDSLTFAAAQPLPVTPDPTGPIRSTSNNPFERLAMSPNPPSLRSPSSFGGLQNNDVSSPPVSINGTASPPPMNMVESSTVVPKETAKTSDKAEPSENHNAGLLNEESSSSRMHETVLSPLSANGTDYFVTPPTSANNHSAPGLPSDPAAKFPSLEELSPPIPSVGKAPSSRPLVTHPETDLNSQLKELDIEESDSDFDEVVDSHKVVPEATAAIEKPTVTPTSILPSNKETTPAVPPAISFDDIFGSHESQEKAPENGTLTPFDVAMNEPDHPKELSGFKTADESSSVAGVNEFDQALGKLSTSVAATPANFSFDTAFDDNFDFTSAKAVEFPQHLAHEQKEVSQQPNFDDIFGASSSAAPAGPSVQLGPNSVAPANVPNFETSFDEVFAGFDSDTAPKSQDNPAVFAASSTVPQTSNEQSIPGSFPSSPQISSMPVAASPRVAEMTVASPLPREVSPPPRVASPKPRLSSSSSKEIHEKPKDPPRHSKLSIRLPFGKKKKHQEPLPAPVQHLSPPMEEPGRSATPASEDDVESVKQLTAMGFSRGQAVDALEKYGYDVQRALNSLLGAQ